MVTLFERRKVSWVELAGHQCEVRQEPQTTGLNKIVTLRGGGWLRSTSRTITISNMHNQFSVTVDGFDTVDANDEDHAMQITRLLASMFFSK